MGLWEAMRARTQPKRNNLDALFLVPSAAITLQTALGFEPTGKRFQMSVAFVHLLKDRKIVHERRIYDFTGLLVQIGILKARPA